MATTPEEYFEEWRAKRKEAAAKTPENHVAEWRETRRTDADPAEVFQAWRARRALSGPTHRPLGPIHPDDIVHQKPGHFRTAALQFFPGADYTGEGIASSDGVLPPSTSAIELRFYEAWISSAPDSLVLAPQHRIEGYVVDFAIVVLMLVIECDGERHHTTKRDRQRDKVRQQIIEAAGWRVIRFTGTELYANADACVVETLRFASENPKDEGR